MTLRIGSLCAGVGGLDLAVSSVLDAGLAWYAQYEPPGKDGKPDTRQYAAQVMAHRFPGVPNHGDITAIDYAGVEPVDILTAGFPCQDISLAGKRAGLMPGTRSGLWSHVARAVEALRPPLVLLENVRSLTSARAHCDLEFCPRCMGEAGGGRRRCSASASTRSCTRRPGRPRVRCGLDGCTRVRHRRPPPALPGLRPRVACCRRPAPRTRTARARMGRAGRTCEPQSHCSRHRGRRTADHGAAVRAGGYATR